jgi:hypothetical protein
MGYGVTTMQTMEIQIFKSRVKGCAKLDNINNKNIQKDANIYSASRRKECYREK